MQQKMQSGLGLECVVSSAMDIARGPYSSQAERILVEYAMNRDGYEKYVLRVSCSFSVLRSKTSRRVANSAFFPPTVSDSVSSECLHLYPPDLKRLTSVDDIRLSSTSQIDKLCVSSNLLPPEINELVAQTTMTTCQNCVLPADSQEVNRDSVSVSDEKRPTLQSNEQNAKDADADHDTRTTLTHLRAIEFDTSISYELKSRVVVKYSPHAKGLTAHVLFTTAFDMQSEPLEVHRFELENIRVPPETYLIQKNNKNNINIAFIAHGLEKTAHELAS